jgi:hypothetical protein
MGIYVDDSVFEQKKQAVLDEWGNILKQEMIIRCPIEYGPMVASIEKEIKQDEVAIGTHGIPYASFVEYGTYSMINAHGAHLPENPVTTWEALRKRNEVGTGQTMPFARSASFFTEEERLGVLKHAFR